ncbi:uncharacterized protein MELLADRAFT_111955 [Melampsora larici-populina 98AG31]|uniref:Secreted protein n=1 Tax=Melampsora larici-populina (strain 98AG31 / pathotype 3-4-7) TaxID=747676 RepID=F4S4X0_MELLP|nr:uncharacterized protein MELLADRAFT_111955 [Melampsora larici-populina 98AG31]EGG00309.1 hypothetical protein MELLADRAFT_111955 [Melampsora larici-populina 98AG31]
MHHRRHLHLRTFLIFWNLYFASSLCIPTEDAKYNTSAQFGRRALAVTHLALESSIPESKEMASVGSLRTTLKSHSSPSTSPLQVKGSLSDELGRKKITPSEGDFVSGLNREVPLGDEQLERFGASTTTPIGGKGKELDKVKTSWWSIHLCTSLKSWWKRIMKGFSSLQKSTIRSFRNIVQSRSHTGVSKSSSSNGISPSDKSIADQGNESTADQATKTTHRSIPDMMTSNLDESMANQATKIPHHNSNEDDEIYHDALIDFQDNPLVKHLTSLTKEAQPSLKENHVPTKAQAALKENLSLKGVQASSKDYHPPVELQSQVESVSLDQSQLAITELAWKLIQRGENWNTIFNKVFKLNFLLAGKVKKHLQKFTNHWEILYDIEKRKSGIDHLHNYKTLREALDNPLETATREGYDRFLATLKNKLDVPIVKNYVHEEKMKDLQVNVAQQLKMWDQNLR